jgi:hypothetical protein
MMASFRERPDAVAASLKQTMIFWQGVVNLAVTLAADCYTMPLRSLLEDLFRGPG